MNMFTKALIALQSELIAFIVRRYNAQTPIEVYAQDSAFVRNDVDLLSSLGVTVLEIPAAWDYIDGSTLVYASHFPINSWKKRMMTSAAMVITNYVKFHLDM